MVLDYIYSSEEKGFYLELMLDKILPWGYEIKFVLIHTGCQHLMASFTLFVVALLYSLLLYSIHCCFIILRHLDRGVYLH